MATEYGLDSSSAALSALQAGECIVALLPVDGAATRAVGQVLLYDAGGDNYIDYVSGMTGAHYVVLAEASDSIADIEMLCIVQGKVKFNALDAIAQADAEIRTALMKHGIVPIQPGVRTS